MRASTEKTATTENLIINDIRNFFPSKLGLPTEDELIKNIHADQYLQKMEELYDLNLLSSRRAIDDVSYILMVDDPTIKSLGWACLGGLQTFNGNYKKAYTAFRVALGNPVSNNVRAYIFAEISNLFRKMGYLKESIAILEAAKDLTREEKLSWRLNTYLGLCRKYSDSEYALQILSKSLQHYREKNDLVRMASVLRHMGTVHIHLKDYKKATELLKQSLSITVENYLPKYQTEAINDLGWVLILQGKFDEARDLFINLIQDDLTPYQLSLALQNLGYLEFENKNYSQAITYHSQSLQLTSRYEMLDLAFEDYYKIGLCNERLGEMGLAYHFYSQGYQLLQDELDIAVPVTGFRKSLLNAYIEFLKMNQKIPYTNVKNHIFEFAANKSLQEIRDIFHRDLLTQHLENSKNAPEFCKQLKIDTRTYFIYQKKLNLKHRSKSEYYHSNQYYRQYLESLMTQTWRDLNYQFEQDLFTHLLMKYHQNKNEIAKVLRISYQQVVLKTKK